MIYVLDFVNMIFFKLVKPNEQLNSLNIYLV